MRKLLFFLLLTAPLFAQDRTICITVDDLPCVNCGAAMTAEEIHQKLLKSFADYKVPAIGFVNESKLYQEKEVVAAQVEVLRNWLRSGHKLGNHTFAHVNPNSTSAEDYKADVQAGEKLTLPLLKEFGQEKKYYRHPFLRHGPTPEYKAEIDRFLRESDYTVAPVTIDNDEYIYAWCYKKAMEQGDEVAMRVIGYDYVDYMKMMIRFYEKEAESLFHREIPQTLLIHANEINAAYLPFILEYLKSRKYRFVDIDQALSDSAYQHEEAHTPHGRSWIYRWQKAAGSAITPMPEISPRMQSWYEGYQAGLNPEIQKLSGAAQELDQIAAQSRVFSKAYQDKDYRQMANLYTEEGVIMPENSLPIAGRVAIEQRWILPEHLRVVLHVTTSVDLEILGETAIDQGYYEGRTLTPEGKEIPWSGKYLIIWKKEEGVWRMDKDIWNGL
jgi:peptidoglycan/xylan/chitin deacetylase (PgdA/CDA1 family)/ketosteroid isomerase-like protein